jgi:hypothetical protein
MGPASWWSPRPRSRRDPDHHPRGRRGGGGSLRDRELRRRGGVPGPRRRPLLPRGGGAARVVLRGAPALSFHRAGGRTQGGREHLHVRRKAVRPGVRRAGGVRPLPGGAPGGRGAHPPVRDRGIAGVPPPALGVAPGPVAPTTARAGRIGAAQEPRPSHGPREPGAVAHHQPAGRHRPPPRGARRGIPHHLPPAGGGPAAGEAPRAGGRAPPRHVPRSLQTPGVRPRPRERRVLPRGPLRRARGRSSPTRSCGRWASRKGATATSSRRATEGRTWRRTTAGGPFSSWRATATSRRTRWKRPS